MTPSFTWLLFAALMVLMQAGFALVTAGLCRAKNVGQVVSGNLMIFVCSLLAFWICGFGFMFGHGFFFTPSAAAANAGAPLFIVSALLVAVAAVIPAGAMAERWTLRSMVVYGFWVGALPIAFFGHWMWGAGWLARLGQSLGLGHGAVDLAGSSVIHMAAGVIALVGGFILGPRAGKYARDGRPKPMPGHNLVFVVIGTLVLLAGWFGFNAAWFDTGPNLDLSVVGLNTLLAGAAGGMAAYVATMRLFGKPDPSMLCNGILAGLAAISAACGFVNSTGAVLTGAVAGFLVVHSVVFFEGRLKIDDPVGAISIHGVGGAWGMISLGLFANGRFGAGWNGVHVLMKAGATQTVVDGAAHTALLTDGWSDVGVTGALGKWFGAPASDWSQLGAQGLALVACLVFVGAMAIAWFKLSNLVSPMRTRRDFEIGGLDLPETGAECYPDFHLTDKGQTGL